MKKQKQFQEILMEKATCKTQNSDILLAFLLLLITVSIYFYLIKYPAKQECLLPFHVTNDKLIKYYKYG